MRMPAGAKEILVKPWDAAVLRRYKLSTYHRLVDAAKVKILREALRKHHGNRTHTARALGLQRSYLIRLIRRLGVEA